MTWMQTASGKSFDLLNPRAEDVDLNDIIHALARLARFSGAPVTTGPLGCPYVVLQHCMLVMQILDAWGCPPQIIREGGWHECDEPYTGDLTRPLQMAVKETFDVQVARAPEAVREWFGGSLDPLQDIRRRVAAVTRSCLGIPLLETPIVKRADNVALAIERRDLMAQCSRDWQLTEYAPRDIKIACVLSAEQVEQDFRARMQEIEERIERKT